MYGRSTFFTSRVASPAIFQTQLAGRNIQFKQHLVRPDKDYGFTMLKVSRQNLVEELLKLKEDRAAREFIRDEIQSALVLGEWLHEETDGWRLKWESCQQQQANLDVLIRKLKTDLQVAETKDTPVDNLIELLIQSKKTEEVSLLKQAQLGLADAQREWNAYATKTSTYEAYVKALGSTLWLGYKSALLFARHNNVTLYVWDKGYSLHLMSELKTSGPEDRKLYVEVEGDSLQYAVRGTNGKKIRGLITQQELREIGISTLPHSGLRTNDDGDCAIHALLGVPDAKGIITCSDAFQKRTQLSQAIRDCKVDDEVYRLASEGIKEIIMSGRFIGLETKALLNEYQTFLTQQDDRSPIIWNRFEQALKTFPDVVTRIHEIHKAAPDTNLRTQFYDALNREESELYALMLSLPKLNEAFIEYNRLQNKTFDWDKNFSRAVLEEYAAFVGRYQQWLLPSELALAARVFKRTVHYYPARAAAVQILNPGQAETVQIRFNGINHFEQLTTSHLTLDALKPYLPTILDFTAKRGHTWGKGAKDSMQLVLKDSVESPSSSTTIHMLLTEGFTRFNLLTEVSAVPEKKSYPLSQPQKILLEIPGYKILERLQEGPSSYIYRALRVTDNHPVIIKVSAQKTLTEKNAQRFRREFELGRQVVSPQVVRYLELKQDPAYGMALIMEDNNAVALNSIIPSQGFSQTDFLELAIQIVQGLQAIHAANIIHNDLKLSNILLQRQTRRITLVDFGCASFLRQKMQPGVSMAQAIGTLAYLSPEQTGRVNRGVDYRTDFYSLGVTFYRMLCGQLPFVATNALGLIHQHLAKQPQPPHERNPTVASALSQLVMKLMAKEAENRYQSCGGLLYDLNECLTALNKTGTIPEFKLGEQDFSSKLMLSQHLYGRESELSTLMKAFERVLRGGREAVMVSGPPGVGKSVLVREIQKPVILKNGYFLSGKFDQLNRNIPYSALTQAFDALIKQWLSGDKASIEDWKQRLLKALGSHAQWVVQVIPTLALLIGQQPLAQIADPNKAKILFNLAFFNFIQAIADASHPLVLFLDDLQWADNTSLELITFLMTQPGIQHLLWLGAYRDTEVTPAHPTLHAIAALQAADVPVQTLTLPPLSLKNLQQWVADSLQMSLTATQPLAELIHRKTAGNPFFVKSFLYALYDQQLLVFSPKTNWQWDMTKIRQHPATENVIALMTHQIQQLPDDTQTALIVASCLGHHVTWRTLQIALASSEDTTYAMLLPALNTEILIQTDDGIYFAHDRVQEAAYHLLAEAKKDRTHLTIGQRLLASPATEEALLLNIVAQINHGRSLVTEPTERLQMARLNLKAGQKAKQATTYAAALDYLYACQRWLEPEALWKTDYLLAFTLYKELAEVEYLSAHFETSQALIKDMQPHLRSILDKVDILHLLILQEIVQGHYQKAITLGEQALQLLGSQLPSDNLTGFIQKAVADIKQKLHDRPLASLLGAPLVVDPEKQALFKILASIYSASYLAGSELLEVSALMAVSLSLTYGHAPESCYGYVMYGQLLCIRFEEYALGYQFGRLAIQLAEKLQLPAQFCKSSVVMLTFIHPWSKPVRQLPALVATTYEACLACGELEYAGYCALLKVLCRLFDQGISLTKVQQEALPLLQFVQHTKNQLPMEGIQAILRLLANLMGKTPDEQSFNVNGIDEAQFEQRINSPFTLCIYHILKAQALYLYGRFKQALDNLTLAKKNLAYIRSHYDSAMFNWIDSLTRLALYPTASSEVQADCLRQVSENQQQMKKWQASCPENFAHKYCLVEAELARLKKEDKQAETLYDQAIAFANRHGFTQEHALAAELAARYWLGREKPICAQGYLNTAFTGYKHWGAKRKLLLLRAQYAELLHAFAPSSLSQLIVSQETTLSGHTLKFLDLSSILKASQTISSTIELPKLLQSMMQIVIENAGAQKGAVLFVETDGAITVQAEYALDGAITTLQKTSLTDWANGAQTVVQYAKRLRQPVVVDNATAHEQFKTDSYIVRTQAKSILCIPILKRNELKALLYLENDLLSYAFTTERVQTVLILTAQMAISLENARYFAEQIALTKQLAEQSARAQVAEESLHAATHDLELALQASKAGTWNWQLGTNKITWDAANCALFGLTPSEFKGTYEAFLACIHPEDRGRVDQECKRCIEQRAPHYMEFRVIWPDGSQYVITSQGHVYQGAKDTPIKMAGVCFDITQRKQLEQERLEALKKIDEEHIRRQEALQYQQQQQEFTETLSHELRNPLQGLMASTELLKTDMEALSTDLTIYQRTPLPESKARIDSRVVSCKEYVANMEECAGHLQTLLGDVLDLAKLKANKMELVTRVFQPKTMLQSVAKMFSAKITAKKLHLNIQLPDEEILIKGDVQRLKQVVINLFSNALKFTEKGTITLGLKVLQATATHLRLQFTVADTGIGMTTEQKARLFQHFSQASADTAVQYGGTGLGLAISDKLIRLMHSQITVESKKGEGTQFSFTLDCERAAASKRFTLAACFAPPLPTTFSPSFPSSTAAKPKSGIPRILVVDDNSINQKVLSDMLKKKGYSVEVANNGKEALDIFSAAEEPFALIFMDIEMPVMDGYEATKRIRQKEQERKLTPTPIICITGHEGDEYMQKILSVGMNAKVGKPFYRKNIYQVIETWIKASPPKAEPVSETVPMARQATL